MACSPYGSRDARPRRLRRILGDADGDFDVDGGDFLVWQRGGSPNPLSPADLATWKGSFGSATPAVGDGWNNRLAVTFGGGCGTNYNQGTSQATAAFSSPS